ncbi:MAG: hypothetical protein KDK78_04865 [Chlamydiia bacterium]|nr:hypothetical protein [Chlamydiia bacterium]
MNKRFKMLALGLLAAFACISGGCTKGEDSHTARDAKSDFTEAKSLIEQAKFADALKILSHYESGLAKYQSTDTDFLQLLIDLRFQQEDVEDLLMLFQHFPSSFAQHEEASIFLASAFIATRQTPQFEELRKAWKGRETLAYKWHGLDGDFLVIEGKPDEAITLLKSRSFEGEQDTGRLVRLALLEGRKSPQTAWDYLAQAQKQDNKNPDIRTLRARLLENFGRMELAQMEYTAAARLAPERPELRDQLALFHIRQNQYISALQVWAYGLKDPTSDKIWAHCIFWQGVTQRINGQIFKDNSVPDGELKPYIEYLLALGPDEYWSPHEFEKVENHKKLLQTEQSTFWLRLIQTLKDGKEDEALSLLEFNNFAPSSWAPDLERNLRRVLLYRQTGQFLLDTDERTPATQPVVNRDGKSVMPEKHQFFKELDEAVAAFKKNPTTRLDPKLQKLILSDEAIAATLMAGGWLEAGLQLHTLAVIPSDLPSWVAYAVAQSYRYNRGPIPALDFIKRQSPSPEMALLEGELLIETGSVSSGIEKLSSVVSTPGSIGMQSVWRLTLAYIDEKRFDDAQVALASHREFSRSITGRELKARIELLRGNKEEATRLYSAIANESTEAQSYLARLAYDQQDWQRAREFTEKLLREHPNSMPLRTNLYKILEKLEQQGQAPDAAR